MQKNMVGIHFKQEHFLPMKLLFQMLQIIKTFRRKRYLRMLAMQIKVNLELKMEKQFLLKQVLNPNLCINC